MKKIFLIAIVLIATNKVNAQANLQYPFSAATFATLTVNNDTLYAPISNRLTYLTLSDTLVGNTVMYATISTGLKAGAELFIRSLNSATARTIQWKSTYFTAATVTTTASKTKVFRFIYDGSKFIYQGVTQID